MDQHFKNVEKAGYGGKFDPCAGLANSGIAGTSPDKEEEDAKAAQLQNEENKDTNKKENGMLILYFSFRKMVDMIEDYK